MKLVVFAHTPPPFHGQSYMVKLLLDGVRESVPALQVFHVDAKLSLNLEAIGKIRWLKLFLILKYCAQAYFHRIVHGADHLYYVPAPGLRVALYRDWIVMALCRPIFGKTILHWHAVGLGEWLEKSARPWEKKISQWLLGKVDLSIVLSEYGRADASRLSPRKIEVVPNGIPDPCPDFERSVFPHRQERLRRRCQEKPTIFTVLFAGVCTAAKGLFTALDAIALVNQRFHARQMPVSIYLTVVGDFVLPEEREEFQDRIARPDLNKPANATEPQQLVRYEGFVAAETKNKIFRDADCFCFPTRYPAEGQPVVILEALAFGLSIIATRWRGIPDLLTGSDARLIGNQDPIAIADALEELLKADVAAINRRVFLSQYSVDKFISRITQALLGT
jgi:glycosyltransferase involved in cell wall biosynthesis